MEASVVLGANYVVAENGRMGDQRALGKGWWHVLLPVRGLALRWLA